ncbi:MAG TPA: phosphoribosylamine--glycine ligase [Chromatiales bacterium]|nr:phosphoribosylamine--glycine ligase [Chromatiales bacterium]
MKVLVVGSGGREHALAWKIAQSPKVRRVLVAPGNAGTAMEPGIDNVAVSAEDLDGLLNLAQRERVDLTVVGPEVPLVAGIVDCFSEAGLRCFGPRAASARLEGSKAFAKDFLQRHGIPTAASRTFSDTASALDWLNSCKLPVVIKADGLAAGKGVVIAHSREQAADAVRAMLEQKAFGDAGQRILIEEFLHGEEASFIAMVDGEHILPLATSQDHKARDNGDTGPNTGGMGAYSPAPVVTDEVSERIMREVMEPAVAGMAADGSPYTGFLYAGLMISPDGTPKVLEFNCRFGDPETQPVLMRLQTDLVELIDAALDGQLDRCAAAWDPRVALGVVMAAGGYPEQYRKGDPIEGLPDDDDADVKVFHAGTRLENGRVLTSGGRVLCVVALADTVSAAQQRAYETVRKIHWPDVYYRTDIGYRAVARERAR